MYGAVAVQGDPAEQAADNGKFTVIQGGSTRAAELSDIVEGNVSASYHLCSNTLGNASVVDGTGTS